MNATAREAQGHTLATAINLGQEWTIAEIRTLESLRIANISIKEIATRLGRSYYSVTNQLLNLGLTHKRANTPKAAPVTVCQSCFTTPASSGACLC